MKLAVLAISLLLSSALAMDILVGSFSRGDIDNTDEIFKSCLALAETRMTKELGSTISNSITRIATFSQVVNGINYKFLNAYKDPKTNAFKLVDTVVYTGPFSSFLSNPTPSVSSFLALTGEAVNMGSNDIKVNNIISGLNKAIGDYTKAKLPDMTYKSIKDIQAFYRFLYSENIFLVTASFTDASNNAKEISIVLSEKAGVYSVLKQLN